MTSENLLKIEGIDSRLNKRYLLRYDGKWVLPTDTNLSAQEVALKYKQLLMVERIFRDMKSALETRPIFHR